MWKEVVSSIGWGKSSGVLYIAIEVLWRKEDTFFKSEEIIICAIVIDVALIPFDCLLSHLSSLLYFDDEEQ